MKKGTIIKHPSSDWGKGVVIENISNDIIKVSFQKVGLKTLSLKYITPIIIEDQPLATEDELDRIVGKERIKKRIYFDERFVDIFNDIKSKYPKHLVFIQNGIYFEVLFEDAEKCSKEFKWKLYEKTLNVPQTGIADFNSLELKHEIWKKLRKLQWPFVVVCQLETGEKPHRKISKVYPEENL